MIVVFDTNVYIAGIITEGICSKLLHRAKAGEFTLVSCPFIIAEIRRVLTKKFKLTPHDLSEAMEPITETIEKVIKHNIKVTDTCRDADDDNVLACAIAADAEYLVTGDADLLEIKTYHGFMIISPRDFEALFI